MSKHKTVYEKYHEMIAAYQQGQDNLAHRLAQEIEKQDGLDDSRMRDVLHVLYMTEDQS